MIGNYLSTHSFKSIKVMIMNKNNTLLDLYILQTIDKMQPEVKNITTSVQTIGRSRLVSRAVCNSASLSTNYTSSPTNMAEPASTSTRAMRTSHGWGLSYVYAAGKASSRASLLALLSCPLFFFYQLILFFTYFFSATNGQVQTSP